MRSIHTTNFENLELFRKGKVRDVYDFKDKLLIVATDRISAFDYIMHQPVPGKGIILNNIATYWFEQTKQIIQNHFITNNLLHFPDECVPYFDALKGRSMLVMKTHPLPIEFVVRGYIAGSAWNSYKQNKKCCGIDLPDGLNEFDKFAEPIFTPATKAENGHDENISFEEMTNIIGKELSMITKDVSIKLYEFAHNKLLSKGVILADTKFEFGLDDDGNLLLIDEALTPDSSRFWSLDDYNNGKLITNYDKQILRDYLLSTNWDKNSEPPDLPENIIDATYHRYEQIYNIIISP